MDFENDGDNIWIGVNKRYLFL